MDRNVNDPLTLSNGENGPFVAIPQMDEARAAFATVHGHPGVTEAC